MHFVMAVTSAIFKTRYSGPFLLGRRGEVEARVESMWRDIATAPRDGQWFVALNRKSGTQYHAYWSAARKCFVNTKTNNRVNPTHWDGIADER